MDIHSGAGYCQSFCLPEACAMREGLGQGKEKMANEETQYRRPDEELLNCSMIVPERLGIYHLFDDFVEIVIRQGKQVDWTKSTLEELVPSESEIGNLLKDDIHKTLWVDQNDNYHGCQSGWGPKSGEYEESENLQTRKKEKTYKLGTSWIDRAQDNKELQNLLNHLEYLWCLGTGERRTWFSKPPVPNCFDSQKGLWASRGGKPSSKRSLSIVGELYSKSEKSGRCQ